MIWRIRIPAADWNRMTHEATEKVNPLWAGGVRDARDEDMDRAIELMTRPNPFLDVLGAHPRKPVTRRDQVIACCRMWRERLTGAWGVLRGRAVADWD